MFPSTISEAQGAFLIGRQILDKALIANEAIEEYRSKKKERKANLILKKHMIMWIGVFGQSNEEKGLWL